MYEYVNKMRVIILDPLTKKIGRSKKNMADETYSYNFFTLEPDRGLGGRPYLPLLPYPRPRGVCGGQGLVKRPVLPVPGSCCR